MSIGTKLAGGLKQQLISAALRRLPWAKLLRKVPTAMLLDIIRERGYLVQVTMPQRFRRGDWVAGGKLGRRQLRTIIHKVVPVRALGREITFLKSVNVSSSWVRTVHLVEQAGLREVAVTFKDGTTCHYMGTNELDFDFLVAAPSKGKEIWNSYYRRAYTIIGVKAVAKAQPAAVAAA